MKGLLLAVGGTGGHIYPAVALGETVRRLWPDVPVAIAGNQEGREAEAAARYQFGFEPVRVVKAPRSPGALLTFPGAVTAGLRDARAALARFQPGVVVGFGGYVSFPTVAAAVLGRCPVYLHEQNLTTGRANRTLLRFATGVFTSFDLTAKAIGAKAAFTGNPCRFDGKPVPQRAEARTALNLHQDRPTLFVFGGSQGAASLNRATLELACSQTPPRNLQILHVTGPRNFDQISAAYRERLSPSGPHVEIRPYLQEMDLAYAASDLVLCRAGATTITEVACFGLPSILVPYPFATENHQDHNARSLTTTGAALLLPDSELNADSLRSQLSRLLDDPAELKRMAAEARKLYKPNAASLMADVLRPYLVTANQSSMETASA